MLRNSLKLGRQKLWTYHREYILESHNLEYLFWECTLNCNLKCKHCGSSAGEDIFKKEVDTKTIKKTFLDISKNFNPSKIAIAVTGGEPLLRKDLFEVMEYAHSLGFKWCLISNGFLVDEKIVKKAMDTKLKSIDISIDGIGKIHDQLRNVEGSYKKALRAVKLFKKANFLNILRVTTVVNSKNIDSLDKMYNVFLKAGATHWRLTNIDPIGRAKTQPRLLLNKKQIYKLLNFIKSKRRENSKLKLTFSCSHFLGDEFEDEVRDHFFHCSTGINIASILHNGDIFVCPNVPRRKELIQGNINFDSFSQVWKKKFQIFRKKHRLKCNECNQCKEKENCLGGSFHSWDFEKNHQSLCFLRENPYL